MAKLIRFVAVFFFLAPITAMFSEPFFEAVFDLIGWDTESWAAPFTRAVMTASSFIGSPALVSLTTYLAVFGVGVWLHYIATIRDRAKPSKSLEFGEMHYRIYNFSNSYSTLRGRWVYYSTPIRDQGRLTAELAAEYIALKNDLHKLAIELPNVDTVTSPENWEEKSQSLSDLLSFLVKFSETESYDEANSHSKQMAASINAKFSNT